MTNSKSRKTGTAPTSTKADAQIYADETSETPSSDLDGVTASEMSAWLQQLENLEINDDGEGDVEEEEDDNTSSSFSLQECIDEFRARRIRRVSVQSREHAPAAEMPNSRDPADEDLINQNRCNKEVERKAKPCKNGFCYCFTSDSGEGGCGAARTTTRASHLRHIKRNRKLDDYHASLAPRHPPKSKEQNKRQSAPAALSNISTKSVAKKRNRIAFVESTERKELTAISRLETASQDEPLIHIIQELHNNCVISEVRVNKYKMQKQQKASRQIEATQRVSSPKKIPAAKLLIKRDHSKESAVDSNKQSLKQEPSAPTLEQISELESSAKTFTHSSSLISSNKSEHCGSHARAKEGGRLLEKRLSRASPKMKTNYFKKPPPKPPRRSSLTTEQTSVASLASTTSSVREAERMLDDFLRQRGVIVPGSREEPRKSSYSKGIQCNAEDLSTKPKWDKRKSYPITHTKEENVIRKPLPSCPSLSDIERVVDSKKGKNFDKNIHHSSPIKDITLGWKEPSISEMLNYDSNGNKKCFKSQAAQAGPQTHIGWQMPPKLELDTVDGVEKRNLASNVATKDTPMKDALFSAQKAKTQKFIWGEQLRQLSPWSKAKSARDTSFRCSSRAFLRKSKKKILRLVSPKKDNKVSHKTSQTSRTIGVQTSPQDTHSYEPTPQSPPGSYHSAVQTSQKSTSTNTQNSNKVVAPAEFDFTRTVSSPPKKAPRATQRKLIYPLHDVVPPAAHPTRRNAERVKTYRSYQSEWDQDVALSKMGYLLSNIRARLEASDDRAMKTFQEIERREQQLAGIDCPDGPITRHQRTRAEVHRSALQRSHDPIYSEIEEDSIHIVGSPLIENRTGVQYANYRREPDVAPNLELLYAKVNKPAKGKIVKNETPTALGKFIHDSMKNRNTFAQNLMPPLREPSSASEASYTSPPAPSSNLSQSLNNIRVMENHSPPKNNRNLCKSDLSLQRSEIFLENLCRGEIIVDGGELERFQKVDNRKLSQSYVSLQSYGLNTQTTQNDIDSPSESASYVVPNDGDTDFDADGSALMNCPSSGTSAAINQSTPKKSQTFITKFSPGDSLSSDFSVTINNDNLHLLQLLNQSNSCPTTPMKLVLLETDSKIGKNRQASSLQEISKYQATLQSTNSSGTLTHLQRIKEALRKSFRKGKNFLRNETKRISSSMSNQPPSERNDKVNQLQTVALEDPNVCDASLESASLNLDWLFDLDQSAPVEEQLYRAVTICRQLPDLGISPEMVEAERLLLFSTLQRQSQKQQRWLVQPQQRAKNGCLFFIDGMRLPVRKDISQDVFYNYFYICTFECDGVIKSTQSVECRNREAIFRDCGIEFNCDEKDAEVNCAIFMLRLRKVSTLPKGVNKTEIMKLTDATLAELSTSNSSCDELISRFRVHATFALRPDDFVPYEYVEGESRKSDTMCLRASHIRNLPLVNLRNSNHLANVISLVGRIEVRLPKQRHSGFLNVQNPHAFHDWNRRWCTLEGIEMCIWHDMDNLDGQTPLLRLDLRGNVQAKPLLPATRELCARPRSFCLQCIVRKADEPVDAAAMFFVAETQDELQMWLEKLNEVLNFITKWIQ